MAALEHVYRYRINVTPGRLFAWFRETISAQVRPWERSIEHTSVWAHEAGEAPAIDFADPEGNVWEVAWVPGAAFDERGGVTWP